MEDKPRADQISPEDCPTPEYHWTHHYCPSCSFTSDKAKADLARTERERELREKPLVEHMHQTDQGWLCPDSGHFVIEGHFLDNRCPFPKDEHRRAIRAFLVYADPKATT